MPHGTAGGSVHWCSPSAKQCGWTCANQEHKGRKMTFLANGAGAIRQHRQRMNLNRSLTPYKKLTQNEL